MFRPRDRAGHTEQAGYQADPGRLRTSPLYRYNNKVTSYCYRLQRTAPRVGILLLLLLTACGGLPYRFEPLDAAPFRARAQTQQHGAVRVTAAVPSPDEAAAIFGITVYERGIQPVWLKIENQGPHRVRFARVSVDREYFSPLEVAYMHRSGFSKPAVTELGHRLHELSMPRQIPAGSTRSGFVFTNSSPGTKSFTVDVFGAEGGDQNFAFFIPVPGFVTDHAEVDWGDLYRTDEIRRVDGEGLRAALTELPLVTRDRTGEQAGLPVSTVLVGNGEDVLSALLRAGWYETARPKGEAVLARTHYLYGRVPDAVFRMRRGSAGDRDELKVWLAPVQVDGMPVWLAQATHHIVRPTKLAQALLDSRLDPDLDDARNYVLQILWYSQGLAKHAWLGGGQAVSVSDPASVFTGARYFSDGYRSVLWPSAAPVSLVETVRVGWDRPPSR